MNKILEVINLNKTFRSHWTFQPKPALADVSFEVYQGEAFGFLGHNGAGKTTTIKCILGLINCNSGTIIFNRSKITPMAHREIGYLPEQPYFYDHLTVEETLDYFARLHGISRQDRKKIIPGTLERVGLLNRSKSKIRALSKGLQQRLGFAQAIINQPKLLLLDEPFSGLDPIGRKEMRELLIDYKKMGTTIFISSHILSDVELFCDRVSIMTNGSIRSIFCIKDIPSYFGEDIELQVTNIPAEKDFETYVIVPAFSKSNCLHANVESLILRYDSTEKAQIALQYAVKTGAKVVHYANVGLGLEEVFVKITEMSKHNNLPSDIALNGVGKRVGL